MKQTYTSNVKYKILKNMSNNVHQFIFVILKWRGGPLIVSPIVAVDLIVFVEHMAGRWLLACLITLAQR